MLVPQNAFRKAAEAQSAALGLPELRVIIYDQAKGEPDDVEGALSAKQVMDQLEVMVRETDT